MRFFANKPPIVVCPWLGYRNRSYGIENGT